MITRSRRHGFATASTGCPACGQLVNMSGSYSTPGQSGDVTPPTSDQPEPVSPRVAEFTARLRALGRPADPSRPAAGLDPVPPRSAAGRHGDGTGSPRGTGHGQRRDRPRTGTTPHVTVTNTNYAAPGAHVGSQHDVIEGSTSFRFTAGDDGDVTTGPGAVDPERVAERLRRAADRTQRAQRRTRTTGTHTTGNTASGDDHVHQQIGTNFGDTHHHRNTD